MPSTIRSATSFSWFGDLSPSLSAGARRAMTGVDDARVLVLPAPDAPLRRLLLQRVLPRPAGQQRNMLRRTPTTPFIEALSAANTGTGAREGGWSVVNVAGTWSPWRAMGCASAVEARGHSTQTRRTSRHLVSSGRFGSPRSCSSCLPASTSHWATRAWPSNRGEGWFGSIGTCAPRTAPTLIKLATQLLNDDQIPFRLKVVNDPAHYDRCDAGVLYVQRADYEQVLHAVRRMLVELGARLKNSTPVFTKALAPGLGLAEQPSVPGDSFGMDRCRLLAEAIVRIHERAVAAGNRSAGGHRGGARRERHQLGDALSESGLTRRVSLLMAASPLPSVLTHSFDTRRGGLFERVPRPRIFLQDGIGFGGPLEGLRFGVALSEPGLDGSFEFGDALEYAAADLLAGDFGEQPFDEVDPGRRCWREVRS